MGTPAETPGTSPAARASGRADGVLDVVIVGAGPAGTAAAVELARAGADVLVVDKATFPRDKCCGDGLTAMALRHLEHLGLRTDAVASWTDVHRVALHSPSGRVVDLPLPSGPGVHAAVARRRDLDAALVDRARASGARVAEGVTLRGAAADDTGVTLTLDGLTAGGHGPATVRARHVIGADGAWSPLRRALGLGPKGYRGDWHAFRQYAANTDIGPDLHVIFEADLLPGYAWAFPLPDGGANIGFGVLRGGPVAVGDMGPLWRELCARPALADLLGPNSEPDGPLRAWPIPARLGAVPLAEGRVMFVGDAAAVTDPLTGEGIGQALMTGMAAAEALVATAGGRVGDASAHYQAAVRRELDLDHRLGRGLATVLAHGRGTRGALRAADTNDWTRRNFARWMFEDYPRAVIATPHRWARGMFHGAGAYAEEPAAV